MSRGTMKSHSIRMSDETLARADDLVRDLAGSSEARACGGGWGRSAVMRLALDRGLGFLEAKASADKLRIGPKPGSKTTITLPRDMPTPEIVTHEGRVLVVGEAYAEPVEEDLPIEEIAEQLVESRDFYEAARLRDEGQPSPRYAKGERIPPYHYSSRPPTKGSDDADNS